MLGSPREEYTSYIAVYRAESGWTVTSRTSFTMSTTCDSTYVDRPKVLIY